MPKSRNCCTLLHFVSQSNNIRFSAKNIFGSPPEAPPTLKRNFTLNCCQVLEFIEDTINCQYDFRNEEYAFRNKQYPRKEKFFSSTENRIRYENILLKKRFEIMQKIKSAPAGSLRPLGMTNPSNKTLGTGTHFLLSIKCLFLLPFQPND